MLKKFTKIDKLSDKEVSELTKIKLSEVKKNRKIINQIYLLPKVDLHTHLGGSLRVDTILDLAKKQNFKLPTFKKKELTSMASKDKYENLEEYLTVFNKITEPLLQEKEALTRCAYEVAIDMAKENVIYFELRFAPMNYTNKGLRPYEIIRAVNAGLEKAEKETGIRGNMILCAIRIYNKHMSPYHKKISTYFSCFNNKQLAQEVARNTAVLAINSKIKDKIHRVVGFDIAGPEKSYPAKNFVDSFKLITKAGLYNTCHAGEGYGWESIKQALVDCNVDRIGHGTNLMNNSTLLEYCRGMRRVPIEVCITSNMQTCNMFKSYREHPVKKFYENNLRIILCTDNRLVSKTTKTKEDFLGHYYHDFSLSDLAVMELNGLKSGFMHSKTRKEIIKFFIKHIKKLLKLNI